MQTKRRGHLVPLTGSKLPGLITLGGRIRGWSYRQNHKKGRWALRVRRDSTAEPPPIAASSKLLRLTKEGDGVLCSLFFCIMDLFLAALRVFPGCVDFL